MSNTFKIVMGVCVVVFAIVIGGYVYTQQRVGSWIEKAEAAENAQDYTLAIELASKVLASSQDNEKGIAIFIRSNYNLGVKSGDSRYFEEVIRAFDQKGRLIAVRVPGLFSIAGLAYLETEGKRPENLKAARDLLEQAVGLDKENGEAHGGLGLIYLLVSGLDLSNPANNFRSVGIQNPELVDKARSQLKEGLRLKPAQVLPKSLLGVIAKYKGDSPGEVGQILSAASIKNAPALSRLLAVLTLLSDGDVATAIPILDTIEEKQNHSWDSTLRFAAISRLNFLNGSLAAAGEQFTFACRNDTAFRFPGLRLDLAQVHSITGQYEKADAALRELEARPEFSRDGGIKWLLALNAYSRSDMKTVRRYLAEAKNLLPNKTSVNIFESSLVTDERELAPLYELILKEDPKSAFANYNMGTVMLKNGKPKEAEVLFRRALQGNSDFIEARLNLAIALQQDGRPDEAAKTFEALLTDHPGLSESLLGIGLLYLGQGKLDEAEAAAKKIPDSSINGPKARYLQARIAQIRGDLSAAVTLARQSIYLNANNDRASTLLGSLLLEQGQVDAALTYFEKVLADRNNTTYTDAVNGKAIAFYLKGKYKEAHDVLSIVINGIQNLGKISIYQMNDGVVYLKEGNATRAVAAFNQAIQADPTAGLPHYNLGVVEEGKGNFKAAEAFYATATRQDSSLTAAYYNRASCLVALGDLNGAIESLKAANSRDKKLPEGFVNQGIILGMKGEFDQAIKLLEESLGKVPPSAVIHNAMAYDYLLSKPPAIDRALAATDKALSIESRNTTAMMLKGTAYLKNGSYPEAARTLQDAFALGQTSNIALRANLAVANLKQLQYAVAVDHLENAYRLASGQTGFRQMSDLRIDLASAYIGIGFYDESLALLNQVQASLGAQTPPDVVTAIAQLGTL